MCRWLRGDDRGFYEVDGSPLDEEPEDVLPWETQQEGDEESDEVEIPIDEDITEEIDALAPYGELAAVCSISKYRFAEVVLYPWEMPKVQETLELRHKDYPCPCCGKGELEFTFKHK